MKVIKLEEEYEPNIIDIIRTVYTLLSLCLSPLTVYFVTCLLKGDIL
jgi:hypothetical protein